MKSTQVIILKSIIDNLDSPIKLNIEFNNIESLERFVTNSSYGLIIDDIIGELRQVYRFNIIEPYKEPLYKTILNFIKNIF